MIETKTNKNDTKSIQFNPGSFYIVAVSLFREWIMLLETQNLDINLSGIPLTLLNGVNHLDKAGSKERSIIRLSSEFGQITATFFNTTHKITIQGNKQAVDLFDSAITPFINKQLVEKSKEINNFNDNMSKQTNRPPPPPAASPTMMAAARTPLPLSPPSPSTRHPLLSLEDDPCTPLRRMDLTKSQILPDLPFLHSIQESPTDEEDYLENSFDFEAGEKQREPTQEEQPPLYPPQKSVIVPTKLTERELGGGAGNQVVSSQGASLVAGPTTSSPPEHLFPNVIIMETTEEDEMVHVDDEKPYQCGTCGKTFRDEASVNNHMEKHTEFALEKRIEKLESMMKNEKKANSYKIELLEHKVATLESQLRRAKQAPPQPAPSAGAPRTTVFPCNTCGYRAPTTHTLKAHIDNTHPNTKAPKAQPTTHNTTHPRAPKTQPTTQQQQTNTQTTVMIGDSNMKTVNCRTVETALGGGKLLCGSHIAATRKEIRTAETGRPGSAYNSEPNYPGSRFRKSSFKEVVPQILAKQPCDNLVLQSPANDLTNLNQVPEHQHLGWAEQSSRNMVNIAEQAIIQKPDLKKVILLEHLPRADSDHLAALAIHSNSALHQFASTSIFSNQIVVASHTSLNPLTEEKTVAIFGPRNRGDGIHLRGAEGPRRHTSSVISALKSVGIAGWSTQAGKGSAKPQVISYSQALKTNNRFQHLNY